MKTVILYMCIYVYYIYIYIYTHIYITPHDIESICALVLRL